MDRKIINKKIILFAVLILTIALFAGCESGGDGKVTNSNVVACINNYPIPSYDIEGELYVSTDDLSHYGFNVSKSGKTYKTDLKKDAEIEPEYYKGKIKYYDKNEAGKEGKIYRKSDSKVVIGDAKYDTVTIGKKTYFPFSALKVFSNGTSFKDDAKKIYINSIASLGADKEFLYEKIKGKNYEAEDFMRLNLSEVNDIFGTDYKREFKDGLAKISYDEKVCPVILYFDFTENDSAKTMLKSEVVKAEYTSKHVSILGGIKTGSLLSEAEKTTESVLNVYDGENKDEYYAKYRVKREYNVIFMLEKEKEDYKITKIIVEK